MDYSNISIPRLFKMLAESLGTGNAAEQRAIAQAIAKLKGISADEAIQQALREKQDHYLPSLSEQSAQAQQAAQLASQMNAPRQEPIVNTHPFGEPLRSPWESAVETSTSTPIDRTVPNSLGLGTTSRQSIANGLQLPTVGNTIPIEPPATVAAPAVEFPTPLLDANGRPAAPTVQPTFGLGRTQTVDLPIVQTMPQANVGPLASLVSPSSPLTSVGSVPEEALIEELTESVTTPTRLTNVSDSALLNALKPKSVSTGTPGSLRAARQVEFDSVPETKLGEVFNALNSSDSGIGNLTGGVPEGFVKPERPVVGDMSAPKARLSGIGESVANAVGTAPTDPRTVTFGSGGLRGTGVSSDAIGLSKPKGVRGMGGGTSGGLTGWFSNAFGRGGASNPANARVAGASQARTGGGLLADGASDRIKGLFGNLSSPQFDWDSRTGLQGWGHNLGGLYTAGKGALDAIGTINNLADSGEESTNAQDLQSDILIAAMSNPMSTYGLTADQLKLLGDIRSGRRDTGMDWSDFDMGGALKGAVSGALSGIPGGWAGVIAGGLGGLAKEGTAGLAAGQRRRNAELEGLYQALSMSNTNYQNALRNRMMERYF